MAIEKFSGKFTSEANGCTVLVNSTIQNIDDLHVLGLYTYLCSKPDSWQPNYKELMTHFHLTKTTTYKYLNKMISLGLMSKKEVREKGRFAYVHYFVHLHPIGVVSKKDESESLINSDVSPFPKKWDPVQPETVIPETYKTKKDLENKDNKNNVVSGTETTNHGGEKNLSPKTEPSYQPFIHVWNQQAAHPEAEMKRVRPGTTKVTNKIIKRIKEIQKLWPELNKLDDYHVVDSVDFTPALF